MNAKPLNTSAHTENQEGPSGPIWSLFVFILDCLCTLWILHPVDYLSSESFDFYHLDLYPTKIKRVVRTRKNYVMIGVSYNDNLVYFPYDKEGFILTDYGVVIT